MQFETLKAEEVPVTVGRITRHHIKSLPPVLIAKLKERGYVLHEGKYYYVSYRIFQELIKECIEESKHA
jgi:hypothetical protein